MNFRKLKEDDLSGPSVGRRGAHNAIHLEKGTRFGRLVVVGIAESYSLSTNKWECLCDCGSIVYAGASALMSGNTKSCGCYNRDIHTSPLLEIGQRFGRLVVTVPDTGERYHKQVVVTCLCDCGATKNVNVQSLKNGNTRSCGCLAIEVAREYNTKHGMRKSLEYNSWRMMKTRCNCPTDDHYPNYGGRGITVCERWNEFINFLEDMGPRPSKAYTLDRINVDGNYCPENCRWSTAEEQCNNRRSSRYATFKGEKKSVAQWCRELKIDVDRVYHLISRGLCPYDAIFLGYPRTQKRRAELNWKGCNGAKDAAA